MIELLSDMPVGVAGISVSGKLSRDDLAVVLVECQGSNAEQVASFALRKKWLGNSAMWTTERVFNLGLSGIPHSALISPEGKIVVAVDLKRAPRTSRNFLAYVDDGRLDGTEFYRSARRKANPKLGYIQGGIRTNLRRALPPVAHEPTTVTDIKHLDAAREARAEQSRSATQRA